MNKRQELYESVKNLELEKVIMERYNKPYTNCSNEDLEKIVNEFAEPFAEEYEKDCTLEDVLTQEDTEEPKEIHLTVSDEKFNDVIKMAEDAIFQAKAAIITLEGFLNIVKSWETV